MQRKMATFMALLLVTLGQFAIDIYLPSLPSMVRDLATTRNLVQQTLSVFLIGFAVAQLVYGPISDRFGRRKVLLVGLLIFIVGAIGATFAHSIKFLIIMRLIQGIGISAANVLCRAILRDLYEGAELAKKVTFLGVLWVLSPIIAPVLGGYIEAYWGWRMNFAFLALFVCLIWIWSFFFLTETKDPATRQSIHPIAIGKNYAKLFSSRLFMGYVLTDFFLYGVFSSFYVAGPFLLQKVLGVSPILFGWLMLIISGGYLLGSFFNIRLIHRLEPIRVIKIGFSSIFVVSLGMVLISASGILTISSLVVPCSLLFCGIALIFTNCIGLSLSIFPLLGGSASAVWGFFAYLGGTFATSTIAYLPERSSVTLSLSFFVLCSLAFLSLKWAGQARS